MKKLLVIAILIFTQNIKADALSDAIRKSDVAAVKKLFYASCHSPERLHFYKELAQETIHLRREAVVVQDLRPRASTSNPESNRYFNASLGAAAISCLSVPLSPFVTRYLYGECPDVDFGDAKFREALEVRSAYWKKDLTVLRSCYGVCFLSFCAAYHLLVKSIKKATLAIQNNYDDAVTIKEILNYCHDLNL